MSWLAAFSDLARFEAQLERMAVEPAAGRWPAGGVVSADLRDERRELARRLAQAVARREYRPAPAMIRLALLDKPRALHVFAPADRVLHGVIAQILHDAMAPLLSDNLFSYRPGRSPGRALARLGDRLRAHRAARPDPRRRGLHVFRGDVRSYTESIPLGAGAPLWSDLRALLGELDAGAWTLLEHVVRPEVVRDGARTQALRGLPTGSPVTAALANLYLAPLDRRLERVAGAFVVRYGDDLLVAQADSAALDEALAHIDDELAARGLVLNPEKARRWFWNGAARADEARPEIPATAAITFLGCRVAFDGSVGLPPAKQRAFLGELRARIQGSTALLGGLGVEERGRGLAELVARSLDPWSSFVAAHAQQVAAVVNDRAQLGELDHAIALTVAETLTGRRGVRAFRELPPRRLREWGLPSLVARRNRGDRR